MSKMNGKRITRAALAMLLSLLLGVGGLAEAPQDAPFNVQRRLNELGYCTETEGSSEERLHAAIREFQRANGLKITGVADSATVTALRSEESVSQKEYLAILAENMNGLGTLASGSYGDSVRTLQETLRDLGYFEDACDGFYGDTTALAVNRFQLANGLKETGIADRAVLIRLFAEEPVRWKDFILENLAAVGDSGEHVRMLQIWLRHMGFFNGDCTGEYGALTRKAVSRYQESVSMEPSGDVDEATARKLFSDAALALAVGATVRRGDGGSRAAEMCEKLRLIGYRTHDAFDMQTEMALIEFQRSNGLSVTGEADSATMAAIRLQAQNGEPAQMSESAERAELNAELMDRAAQTALALLGERAEFDGNDDFVRYIYLKCGAELPSNMDETAMPLPEGSPLRVGWAICANADGHVIWGIAVSEDSIILSDASGYIVMRCLSVTNQDEVRVLRDML